MDKLWIGMCEYYLKIRLDRLSNTTKFSLWVQSVLPLLHRTCSVTREALGLLQVIQSAAGPFGLLQVKHSTTGAFRLLHMIVYAESSV
jgi:hypothetical protein